MAESLVDFLDETLRQELALPGLRDLIPTPGDVAHALFGTKSLDAIGKSVGSSVQGAVKGGVTALPRSPF